MYRDIDTHVRISNIQIFFIDYLFEWCDNVHPEVKKIILNTKNRSVIEISTSSDGQTPKYDNNTVFSISIIPDADESISIDISELFIDFFR